MSFSDSWYGCILFIIILLLDILVQIQAVLDIMTIRDMGLDLVGRPPKNIPKAMGTSALEK